MKIGFTFSEVLEMDLSDFYDYIEVNSILEDEQLLVSMRGGRMPVVNSDKAVKTVSNRIEIALGKNPFIPKKSEIQRTKEILKGQKYF